MNMASSHFCRFALYPTRPQRIQPQAAAVVAMLMIVANMPRYYDRAFRETGRRNYRRAGPRRGASHIVRKPILRGCGPVSHILGCGMIKRTTTLTGAVQWPDVIGAMRNGEGHMMVGPDCPVCGRPMRFFVIEEPSLQKRSHFECLDCADDSATGRAELPMPSLANVGNEKGRPKRTRGL